MKINKTWAILGAALVVGALAAFGAHRYINNQLAEIDARDKNRRTVKVVVAKQDLIRGTKLTVDNIAVRTIPAEYAHSGAVLPEQFDRIENQAIAYNVKSGEAIMWAQLEGKRAQTFSNRVPVGRRAMSVSVDEISSISGMLEPGDTIDLLVTLDRKGKKVTLPIIQSVTVLAAGQRVASDSVNGERRSFTTITLDTTPDEARRVIVAREAGKVTALLRNPQDKDLIPDVNDDWNAFFGSSENGIASGIPVIYGGRGKLTEDIPKLGSNFLNPPVDSATSPLRFTATAIQPHISPDAEVITNSFVKAH